MDRREFVHNACNETNVCDETFKAKQRRRLGICAIILLICVAYYVWVTITGLTIPCGFRLITGLKCPGCGITHMFIDMAKLDFVKAFHDNQLVFVTLPLLVAEIVYVMYYSAVKQKTIPRWNEVAMIIYIVMLIVFGILRNIPAIGL